MYNTHRGLTRTLQFPFRKLPRHNKDLYVTTESDFHCRNLLGPQKRDLLNVVSYHLSILIFVENKPKSHT